MFNFTISKVNPVMDSKLRVGDMFIQNKDSDDKKVYLTVEVLDDLKLANINSGQMYNKEGYSGFARQEVLDILTEHFYKYSWTFIPAEDIIAKNVDIVLIDTK
ncbi:MAG: hypothetical protein PHY47_12780 [Lachnospiraceae bacterium]|nr:hypothetical protein [Lachnospiraceae bacterium]